MAASGTGCRNHRCVRCDHRSGAPSSDTERTFAEQLPDIEAKLAEAQQLQARQARCVQRRGSWAWFSPRRLPLKSSTRC